MAQRPRGQKISKARNDIIRTSGEILPDGSVIELVASSEDRLDLLFWNKHEKIVAPQIEHLGHVYQPPDVHETMRRAIRFPKNATGYGTTRKLFSQMLDLFERHVGLAQPEAALMTAWTNSTWFPDCVSSPPTLMISGPDMGHAITLFRLFNCLCRRPLVLADINRKALFSLARLQSTLLINQPGLSPKIRDLCSTSNYRGVYMFGTGDKVLGVVGSKAVFLGMPDTWSDQDLQFALLPAQRELAPLDEQQQAEMANRFQPQLLMYRLHNLQKVREFHSPGQELNLPNTEIARNLAACIQAEPEVAQAMIPLLRRHEQDTLAQRAHDPNRAIIEVIWAPSHESKEIGVTQVTELTNALLRNRGEILEYSSVEIGWMLKNLGFYRHRDGTGMVLRFSREHCLLVHQRAAQWGLNLRPGEGCSSCATGK